MSERLTTSGIPAPQPDADLGYLFRLAHQRFRALLDSEHQARGTGSLERRIRDAEGNLFAATGADVEEFFIELARTGLRVRVLSHGRGPAVVLLHGVTESAAIWAPLFTKLRHFRLLAVDL